MGFFAEILTYRNFGGFVMKKNPFSTKILAFDALMIALYVVLGFLKIPIGNVLRISLAPFSVIISAILFGPVNGLIVGFLGEFLSQVLGPYGLTPTTLLWSLPEAVRGLLLGLAIAVFFGKSLEALKAKRLVAYLLVSVVIGIVASLLNTFALYVDSKMFGYYNEYMVFGALAIRLTMAVVVSGGLGYIALPIVSALRRNNMK